MPTPDREALDARLRAVERALTDPDATLDRPPGTQPDDTPDDTADTARAAGGSDGGPAAGAEPDDDGAPAGTRPSRDALPAGDPAAVPDPEPGTTERDANTRTGRPGGDTRETADGTDGPDESTRAPPSRAALERRLLDLEAAVQALRGCLERPTDAAPGSPDGAATVTVPEPDTDPRRATSGRWPDDLAADGGHQRGDGPGRG